MVFAFGRVASSAAVAAAVMVLTAGCSTVVMREPAAPAASVSPDRAGLAAAAERVSATKWPKPDSGSLGGMLGLGEGRTTEKDAVIAYVAALGAGPGRSVAVLKDAYFHIDAAYALAAAAESAAASVEPTADDIALVETAIGELRGARDIYLASLRRLGEDGDGAEPRTEQSLRAAFNRAIREIGDAADAMSDRLTARRLGAARRPSPIAASHFAAGGL
ncbi:MAG: hypothetical protein K2Q06_02805 [Parvularculaceae bacterium]|nr:hypothetical protein [Parvularculaceae bacterium]